VARKAVLNPGTGRSVDRLINFSDAVVAVAVTLLALPLVDIPGPTGDQNAWTVLSEHASEIWTFLFTFYVVAVMWLAHNRILNSIARYDAAIFWLNTTWLVAIVLLPWVSAMFGESASCTGAPWPRSPCSARDWAATCDGTRNSCRTRRTYSPLRTGAGSPCAGP
jgi:branched-subunit amino acid ABC-type transport system permease component